MFQESLASRQGSVNEEHGGDILVRKKMNNSSLVRKGIELALLESVEQDRFLTEKEQKTKKSLEELHRSKVEELNRNVFKEIKAWNA